MRSPQREIGLTDPHDVPRNWARRMAVFLHLYNTGWSPRGRVADQPDSRPKPVGEGRPGDRSADV